jgi:hypothetical protein
LSAVKELDVGRKKAEGKPKRYGTLIRVSDEFADMITRASSFEGISVAEFATKYLFPITEKRYRDAVLKEANRMKGEGK